MRVDLSRRRRGTERGQTLAIVAISSIVLFGATALAVDLSLQTHLRRDIQNVADGAALAGAQDLVDPTSTAAAVQVGRQNAVISALKILHNRIGFTVSGASWATNLVQTNCSTTGSVCDLDNQTFTDATGAGSNDVTISIDTPPKTAYQYGESTSFNGSSHYNPYDGNSQYIEVTVRRVSKNGFAGVLGAPTGTEGGHSVAFHQPPGVGFGFALYADQVVSGGNQDEVIKGDVYAGRDINPQSSGHASFCAATQSDGTGGNIVFGTPQGPPSTDDGLDQWEVSNNFPHDPDTVHINTTNCATSLGSNTVSQTSSSAQASSCPGAVKGIALGSGSAWNSSIKACVANPAITAPTFTGPNYTDPNTTAYCGLQSGWTSYQPGLYQCTANNRSAITVDHTLSKGVYHVEHNPNCSNSCTDVSISNTAVAADPTAANCASTGYQTYICGVTFVLGQNATIGVSGNSASVLLTPYYPTNPSGNDGRFPIYSPNNVTGASLSVSNNGATFTTAGTVYMPGGSVNVGQNAFLYIQGQAIVDNWAVQSGNHTNPDISYDSGRIATFVETLQLVE